MSSSQPSGNIPSETEDSRPVHYDPTDPFWDDPDDDDDDMDYAPAPEDEDEDEDDGTLLFHDAEENLSGVQIEVEFGNDEGEDEDDEDEDGEDDEDEIGQEEDDGGHEHVVPLQRDIVMELIRSGGLERVLAHASPHRAGLLGRFFASDDDDENESDESGSEYRPSTGYDSVHPKRRTPRGRAAFPKVPSEQGRELMESGTFGSNSRSEDTILRKKKRLAYKLMRREMGLGSEGRQKISNRIVKQDMIPESVADSIIHYNARCYSGQFSDDGNFFFSCAQDFRVRMYDTSNPYDWKYYKTVVYPSGQWTITDASLSPDNRFLAYSSIRSIVCLAPTDPENDQEPTLLNFGNTGSRTRQGYDNFFGIWSIRFSGDGREIVAGTGDNSVYVYDIERQQSILRIPGHDDDVNAVCYGDSQSPHILYSGSDDTTLKIWDRRSMGDGREAGVFLGHTEGLTYVDSKGDGRYVLSNGKEQMAKLWDLRKMTTPDRADGIDTTAYTTHFDYRMNAYDESKYRPHPLDTSLVTFRGHRVLKTLIRCHFSPPGSTDSRYVYSGSADGSVYVWNLDATLAGKVNVLEATENSRPRDPELLDETYGFYTRGGGGWSTCVRDASWHPSAPIIAATSWNGWGTSQGTCTVHTWNDGVGEDEAEPKMGRRVNGKLENDPRLYRSRERSRSRTRARWLGQFMRAGYATNL